MGAPSAGPPLYILYASRYCLLGIDCYMLGNTGHLMSQEVAGAAEHNSENLFASTSPERSLVPKTYSSNLNQALGRMFDSLINWRLCVPGLLHLALMNY